MITPSDRLDQVIRSYLEAVERALAGLHEERRRELLADLSDHIEAERASLDEPSEAAVRGILDRLGDPAVIAAEARLFEEKQTPPPFARPAPPPYPPAPYPPHPPLAAGRRGLGPLGWSLIAVGVIALLCLAIGAGAFVVFLAPSQERPLPVSTASQLDPTHS